MEISQEIPKQFDPNSASKFRVLDLLAKSVSPSLAQEERMAVDSELTQLGLVSLQQHVYDVVSIITTPDIPDSNP